MPLNKTSLESALMDASYMAEMALEFIGQTLGFDQLTVTTPLDASERRLLMFAVSETKAKVQRVKDIFYDQ